MRYSYLDIFMHKKQLCEPVPDVVFLVSVKETISDVKHWQLGRLRGLAGGGVSRPTPGRGEVEGSGRGSPGPHLGEVVVRSPGSHPGGEVSQHALRQMPPPQTATAVGGTHPTGMHSCLYILLGLSP